uniref:Uncharacterized protein n=1 Tax=Amphimedon queenslandica TaxID=400682 RepID=A0A1X7SZV2_AMPQE
MIDVSQWRASIGLWNYCQAASSRPANGHHSHSFKAAVDSKSGSTTSGEKTSKLPPALSLIALILLLFHSLSLLRHILMIPPTGNCYQVQCTTSVTVTDTNYLQSVVLPGGSSSNLIYNNLYLIVCLHMLLLLSGDVELNPGPMMNDRPTVSLLIQWLDPLVDWQSFGCCLPGITQHDVSKIEADYSKVNDRKRELYSKWLSVYSEAKWSDVITALTIRKENTLAQNIIDRCPLVSSDNGNAATVSTIKKQEVKFNTKEELNKSFTDLVTEVQTAFDEKETSDPKLLINMTRWIERYMNWNDKLTNASLNETFKIIHPYYDFIDCNLIVDLSEKFLNVKLAQSLLKHITIITGSVVIKYRVLDSTADSLIEYTGGKLQFMRLIGIFSLDINDHPVLQEDENMNFTFELALFEAVTAGNIEAVKFLLQLVYIDHTNEEGRTPLMLACERGHEDIVHSLLSAGANVNIQDNKGWTALMRASEHNHISIIHVLLQANANPHLKKSNGSNALMIASYYGNYEVVELLISKGVDYKYQREDGVNAFILACQNGHIQIVELLLKEQVDPNVQRNDGGNAFMLACQNGHIQIVELLLKEPVDPNVQEKDGWNAFMLACKNGHTQTVELLLKEQVDPNVQEKDGWNAFMLACENGHTQIVELLLKEQVGPNVQRNDGGNAFMLACQNGHIQIVELLLKKQVDPNVQEKDGWNAFMLACKNGHTQTVELLLKEQVDPNVQEKDGWNAFMLACENGHTQIVELLLKEQVNPNVQDRKGHTALIIASAHGHHEVVKLLLDWE